MNNRIFGIGLASIDFLGVVDHIPRPDSVVEMGQFSIQGGGNAATALVTAAHLGLETRFCGKISDDMFGTFILDGLTNMGIDTSGVVVEPGRVSPFTFVGVEATDGHRVLYHTRGNCSPLVPDEIDLTSIEWASCLLVDGYQIKAQVTAARQAAAAGIPVVLDASHIQEKGMGELLSDANILIATERFAAEVAPMGEVEDSLHELTRMGPHTVVVTLGEEGSIGLDATGIVRVRALPIDSTDTTGAGDVYRGAFLYAHLQGWPLGRCMEFASAAAGLSCQTLGGRAGIPNLEQITETLAAHKTS
ncbi:MAG: hypothetical protein J7M25_08955 [Deltaproteobacteria bacterium]|nr:hypothetical protein [Deltaproteobacteria bacterium]